MMAMMLDHLVLAAPDLDAAIREFTELTGVRPAPGGSHLGLGTANQLVDLGAGGYPEITGPDVQQPAPAQPRPFGIDDLAAPRLVAWAVRTDDLDGLLARARAAGYDPGEPRAMSRRTAEGELLQWRLTMPRLDHGGGPGPFPVDRGDPPPPPSRAPPPA